MKGACCCRAVWQPGERAGLDGGRGGNSYALAIEERSEVRPTKASTTTATTQATTSAQATQAAATT